MPITSSLSIFFSRFRCPERFSLNPIIHPATLTIPMHPWRIGLSHRHLASRAPSRKHWVRVQQFQLLPPRQSLHWGVQNKLIVVITRPHWLPLLRCWHIRIGGKVEARVTGYTCGMDSTDQVRVVGVKLAAIALR